MKTTYRDRIEHKFEQHRDSYTQHVRRYRANAKHERTRLRESAELDDIATLYGLRLRR